ncbi:MAG: ATP-binding protein [Gemmobacter sp.]|uniref:ATP-binding protein n=1 Tax=Gemmobacter sp. TaxID=1898957 RepID=UPI00391C4662
MSVESLRMPGTVRLVFPAEPFAVRCALERLFAVLPVGLFDDDARGSAEIALTEVLNNIVEHGYAGEPGLIEVVIRPLQDGLHCVVTDRGRPMPGGVPPGAELPAASGGDLPEGGFGWFLIRCLAQDITYVRHGAANRLAFRLPARGSLTVG